MIPTRFVPKQNNNSLPVYADTPLWLTSPPPASVVTKPVVAKKADAFQSTQVTATSHTLNSKPFNLVPFVLLGGGLATVAVVVAVYHNKANGQWKKIIPTIQEDLGKVFGNKTKQQAEKSVESAVTPDEILSSSPPVKESLSLPTSPSTLQSSIIPEPTSNLQPPTSNLQNYKRSK